jgi:hypothetical protein
MANQAFRIVSIIGWIAFVAWVVAAPGCAGPDVDGFRVDADADGTASIEAALASWCDAGGLCGHISRDGASTITMSPEPQVECPGYGLRTGCARMHGDATDIEIGATPFVTTALLHELGHHYGCRIHSPDPSDVMHAYVDTVSATAPTQWDVLCALKGGGK